MFSKNVGSLDRVIRIVVGVALLAAFFLMPQAPYRWALLIGIIPLLTGILGSCGVYTVLGVNTCNMKR